MHARSASEIVSQREALALLGLSARVEGEALTAAFRAAIKTARPDGPRGDADRFRRIIAAWRLLQTRDAPLALTAPAHQSPTLPVVDITAMAALKASAVEVLIGARRLRIRVPAGMRTGDHLRLKGAAEEDGDLFLPVLIRASEGLSAVGDDLYMTAHVSPRLLEDGGRLEVETHDGPRSVWIVAGQPPRLRLKHLGLPARGTRPQGHLFVTLRACEDAPSPAEDMLSRFTRVWTPDRMAA